MADRFLPGEDPRSYVPHHRERGRKRFTYTYDDLARLYDVSVRTVYNWGVDAGRPFDPSDLEDICRRWSERASHGAGHR